MTDSKLLPLEAMTNAAIREEAFSGSEPVSTAQAMEEIARVFGKPSRSAALLISPTDLKAPKKVDARSPSTLNRAALSLLAASPDTDEEAVSKALSRAGLTREMIPQLMESPDWAGTVARLCQQYMYVTALPKIVAAQITKAALGDTNASKHLAEMFGRSDKDNYDEQTRALAEASPETRLRAAQASLEELQQIIADHSRAAAKPEAVAAAQAKAIASLTERRPT